MCLCLSTGTRASDLRLRSAVTVGPESSDATQHAFAAHEALPFNVPCNSCAAFNLNLDIVAPECIVPEVSYKTKYAVISLLPACAMGFFLLLQGMTLLYRCLIMRRKIKELAADRATTISSLLATMYVFYIYETKTQLVSKHLRDTCYSQNEFPLFCCCSLDS